MQVPDTVTLGEEFDLKVSIINPLAEPLSSGEFHIEAPGIAKDLSVVLR